ncbi:hypothetical protein FH972_025929 [Carpinus fangiana]|uniref:Protein arginine methyltransferase NDUFAF7 n=1 Tax=Carpinus fangiana TaxID=176857 RepID=A0A5N6L2Z9_9ROSI|nr:hypothetical protein FH972_025929 [Carpinus fangiana]
MDSPAASLFFKRLLSNAVCQSCRQSVAQARHGIVQPLTFQRAAGTYSRLKKEAETKKSRKEWGTTADIWQPRSGLKSQDVVEEFKEYPLTTAEELRHKNRRPRRQKMLMRDFIEDSLYNPHYGYFSSQATIFNPGEPFDFPSISDEAEFNKLLDDRYHIFENELDERAPNDTRQLWHTPTELFRPHYAEAMARYLISNYKLSLFPFNDLIIYELGAGNGTFMINVLDYIRAVEPDVYDRTRYKIIEISASLAKTQRERVAAAGHADKVEIINQSIHSWDTFVPQPCFVVAMEVIDNFGHDAIRYDLATEAPAQSHVLVDADGDFYERFEPHLDPLAARYLRVRDAASRAPYRHPLRSGRLLRNIKSRVMGGRGADGGRLGWSQPEYIPTRLLQFFDVLQQYFPAHRLLLSDFDRLPDAVPGINAPVVQTRYRRRTIAVTTPLVHQGYFDIFFPTDFGVMEDVYRAVTGRLTRVASHEAFMEQWADIDETTTRSGENPLLSWYKNARMMMTV